MAVSSSQTLNGLTARPRLEPLDPPWRARSVVQAAGDATGGALNLSTVVPAGKTFLPAFIEVETTAAPASLLFRIDIQYSSNARWRQSGVFVVGGTTDPVCAHSIVSIPALLLDPLALIQVQVPNENGITYRMRLAGVLWQESDANRLPNRLLFPYLAR